jgi:hypothetical protein
MQQPERGFLLEISAAKMLKSFREWPEKHLHGNVAAIIFWLAERDRRRLSVIGGDVGRPLTCCTGE